MMSGRCRFAAWLLAGTLCLSGFSLADTQAHHKQKAKKQLPPPLPSGPRGPVQQVPLDSIPAVAPQVTYHQGQLTIVAPNSTLGDILRAVRKQTSAEIDVPSNATERVVTHLGPGPAREILAELLNGSHFNYILLGSPQDSNLLTKVVLVAKTGPDNPPAPQPGETQAANAPQPEPPAPAAEAADEAQDDSTMDDNADQEAEQTAPPPEQPGVKSPQQLLQEMQQRQLQMQQQQQQQQQPGMTGQPSGYPPPPPGTPVPQRPPQEQQQ